MSVLKIEYVPIEEIKPYEGNAKLHPDEQIEQIKKSIQDVGFRDPIGIWNGVIVEGHGRYIAAQELGMKEVPVIRLDDMTDKQRREYMLVHNKLTMNSSWNFEALQEEMEHLSEDGIDMSEFGFDEMEIPDIDGIFGESAPKEKDKENETHMIVCPHCGEQIEVDSEFNVVM